MSLTGEGHDGVVNQIAGQASPRDDDDSDGGGGNVAKVYRYPTLFRFSLASTREGNGLDVHPLLPASGAQSGSI